MPALLPIEGNRQHLDGGAMFGNAPRALWARWHAPDEQNRILLACRSLLVDEGERRILFEAGIGTFFPPSMRERFGVEPAEHLLLAGLAQHGLSPEDIDLVVLSHLHFDHAGGLLSPWQANHDPALVFPRARFVVGQRAWERAQAPHPRDRASFIPGLVKLLEESGRLVLVNTPTHPELGSGYRFRVSDGHTPGMLLTRIEATGVTVHVCADLIPGTAWVREAITMGYDRYPELLVDEKRALLEEAEAGGDWLFFTHDPDWAFARPGRDEKGRYIAMDTCKHSIPT